MCKKQGTNSISPYSKKQALEDVEVSKIGNSRKLGQPIYELHEQLQAAFIAYDEGIQSSDITLGSAIWRRFYQMNYVEPFNIEKLVKYTRKQVLLLDMLSNKDILQSRNIWKDI